jgi:hypothetical protein
MKTKNFLFGALVVTGLLVMNSCQKDKETQTLSEQVAEEDAGVEEIANVFDEQIDLYASSDIDDNYFGSTVLKSTSTEITYPVITVVFPEQTRWPVEITIDYGPENINVGSGKGPRDTVVVKMRGKIVIEKTGPHFAAGAQTTVTFDGYYINDIRIEGTQEYLNSGLNEVQNPVFTWTEDLTFTTVDGFEVTRTVSKTREMIAGDDTKKNIWDDEFMVNGTVTGGNSNGWSYEHIITDLHRKRVCRFPVSGTIAVTNTKTTFVLNYGTGECDALATVTDAQGNIYTIVLGRKWVSK